MHFGMYEKWLLFSTNQRRKEDNGTSWGTALPDVLRAGHFRSYVIPNLPDPWPVVGVLPDDADR